MERMLRRPITGTALIVLSMLWLMAGIDAQQNTRQRRAKKHDSTVSIRPAKKGLPILKALAAEMPRLVLQRNSPTVVGFPLLGYVNFSSDGKLIATSGQGTVTQVWEVETGRLLRELPTAATGANGDVPSAVAFSDDKEWLAWAFEGSIKIFNIITGELVRELKTSPLRRSEVNQIQVISFSNDRKTLFVTQDADSLGGRAFELLVVDIESKKILSKRPVGSWGESGPSADSKIAWVKRIQDLRGAEAKLRAFGGEFKEMKTNSYKLEAIAVTKNADLIALGQSPVESDPPAENDPQNIVRIVKLADGKELSRLQGYAATDEPSEFTWQAAIETSGASRAGLKDQTKHDWQLPGDKLEAAIFSSNNKYRAIEVEDTQHNFAVAVVEYPSGILVKRIQSEGTVNAVSNDAKFLILKEKGDLKVVGLQDSVVRATIPTQDENLNTIDGDGVLGVALSEDSSSLAFFRGDDAELQDAGDIQHAHIVIWDIAKGHERGRIPVPKNLGYEPADLALSPDGNLVAASFEDHAGPKVWLFDVRTGKLKVRLIGHEINVADVIFSSDGRLIATNSSDDTARVWDADTGKERFRLYKPGIHLQFSSDVRFLFSDKVLYRVSDGAEVCRFFKLANGIDAIVAPDGRFDVNDFEHLKGLQWVMPTEPFKTIPIEIFMRDYYEPQLLPRLLKCNKENNCDQQFKPVHDISKLNRVQPPLKISTVSLPDADGYVNVTIEVGKGVGEYRADGKESIRTTGVYDVRLFRDGQLVGTYPWNSAETLLEQSARDSSASSKLGAEAGPDKELHDWRKASEVRPSESVKSDPKTGKMTLSFRVRLPRGKDLSQMEFTAYAFNEDRVKSETAHWAWPEAMKAQLPKAQPVQRRAYVISVGVNDSQVEQWRLNYAANDARLMNEVLTAQLKGMGEYEVVPVLLEADDEVRDGKNVSVRDATKAKIKAMLDLLAGKQVNDEVRRSIPNYQEIKRATPDDLVLFSFSGHGYADRNGTFFILPYDVQGGSESGLPDLQSCISSDELSLWLRDVDAGEMVMIVDACHAAAAVQGSGFKPGPMGSRGLGQLSYDKGMRILTATQAADAAIEIGGQISQGLLSYALVKEGLERKKADFEPVDGTVGLREWLDYGVKDVPELYKQISSGELRTVGRGTVVVGVDNQQQPSLFDFARKRADVTLMKISTPR